MEIKLSANTAPSSIPPPQLVKLLNTLGLTSHTAKAHNTQQLSILEAGALLKQLPPDTEIAKQLLIALKANQGSDNKNLIIATLAQLIATTGKASQASDGKPWVMLNFPVKENALISISIKHNTAQFKLVPSSTLVDRQSANPIRNHSAQITNNDYPAKLKLIQEAVRYYLPRQDVKLQAVKLIHNTNTQNQPSTALLQAVPKQAQTSIQKTIHSIEVFKTSLAQVANLKPSDVIKALTNSGVLLEHKLASLTQTGNQNSRPTPLPSELAVDVKSLLLLINQLTSSVHTATVLKPEAGAIDELLLYLFPSKAKKGEPTKLQPDERNSALQHLSQIVQSSIARISTHQTTGLQSQLTEAASNLTLNADLLFRMHQEVLPVTIKIKSKTGADKKDKKKRKRQWSILMEWYFEGTTHFQAKIHIEDNHIRSSLATNSNEIRQRINEHLPELSEQLSKEGLIIDQLNCSLCKPSLDSNNFEQAQLQTLIDVRT